MCKIRAFLSTMEKDITNSYSITELNIVPLVLGAHVDLNNLIVNNSVQFLNINVLESYRAVCEMRVGLYIFILPAEVLDEWLLPHKGINFIFVQLLQRRNIRPKALLSILAVLHALRKGHIHRMHVGCG